MGLHDDTIARDISKYWKRTLGPHHVNCQDHLETNGAACEDERSIPTRYITIPSCIAPLEIIFKRPKRIIFNPPATIVFWADGTKTVVKCQKGTEFSPYFGFTAALAKKIYGSNSRVNKIVEFSREKSSEQNRESEIKGGKEE